MPVTEQRAVIYASTTITFEMMLRPRLMATIWQAESFNHAEEWPLEGSTADALSRGLVQARFNYTVSDYRPHRRASLEMVGTLPGTLTYILIPHSDMECDLTIRWDYKIPGGPVGDDLRFAIDHGWIDETLQRALDRIKTIAEHEVSRAVIHLESLPQDDDHKAAD